VTTYLQSAISPSPKNLHDYKILRAIGRATPQQLQFRRSLVPFIDMLWCVNLHRSHMLATGGVWKGSVPCFAE